MIQQGVVDWKKLEYRGIKRRIGDCSLFVKLSGTLATAWSEPVEYIERHSPDGFQWGYGGSGPADTALSILTDFCRRTGRDVEVAERLYQAFKRNKIASIEGNLHITALEIDEWIKANS